MKYSIPASANERHVREKISVNSWLLQYSRYSIEQGQYFLGIFVQRSRGGRVMKLTIYKISNHKQTIKDCNTAREYERLRTVS